MVRKRIFNIHVLSLKFVYTYNENIPLRLTNKFKFYNIITYSLNVSITSSYFSCFLVLYYFNILNKISYLWNSFNRSSATLRKTAYYFSRLCYLRETINTKTHLLLLILIIYSKVFCVLRCSYNVQF